MPEIGSILDDREKTHGSFANVATTAQEIKAALARGASFPELDPVMRESLDLIATKLARIANGNPRELDHWKDIAGYATLCFRPAPNMGFDE